MRRPHRGIAVAALLVGAAECARPTPPIAAAPPAPRRLTILATSEIRGTPEPCGCQSDPLGDVARVATLLAEARAGGPALLVDAGGLRYSDQPTADAARPQAELKARFLEQAMSDLGVPTALGADDLRYGVATAGVGRLAANVRAEGLVLAPSPVRDLDGLRVGIFGLLDPARVPAPLAQTVLADDPIDTAKREVASLRARGATLVIALVHGNRALARSILRSVPGIGIAVAGAEGGEAGAEAEQVGDAILVQPADEAQRVARVVLHADGPRLSTRLVDGAEGRARELARLDKKVGEVDRRIAALESDRAADPAFLITQRERRAALAAERERLRSAPTAAPVGGWAEASLVPVRRTIAREPRLAAAMKQLDADAGELNRKAGAAIPVPAPAKGEPRYVGDEECELCHAAAVTLWKTTVHAQAWSALTEVNKQWSFDCIKCHVTGYGRAGGSAIAHVENLEAVQCEVCHGPGSLHAASAAAAKKVKLASPTESTCKDCHTKDHSDTFQYEPYLRDVLGPGHGAKRRLALGDGPTGHELRHSAKQRAKEGASAM